MLRLAPSIVASASAPITLGGHRSRGKNGIWSITTIAVAETIFFSSCLSSVQPFRQPRSNDRPTTLHMKGVRHHQCLYLLLRVAKGGGQKLVDGEHRYSSSWNYLPLQIVVLPYFPHGRARRFLDLPYAYLCRSGGGECGLLGGEKVIMTPPPSPPLPRTVQQGSEG